MLGMTIKQPQGQAQACVIWMHGLGSSAANMMMLVNQLNVGLGVKHVCLEAPVRPVTWNNHALTPAWYDIVGNRLLDRQDEAGVIQSQRAINQVIDGLLVEGWRASQIYLAGFSQGGAMALYTGLNSVHRLGGVMSLSAYLPLAETISPILAKDTPLFIAYGVLDPIVLPQWTLQSVDFLRQHQFSQLEVQHYRMEHTFCVDEIKAISLWINQQATRVIAVDGEQA